MYINKKIIEIENFNVIIHNINAFSYLCNDKILNVLENRFYTIVEVQMKKEKLYFFFILQYFQLTFRCLVKQIF